MTYIPKPVTESIVGRVNLTDYDDEMSQEVTRRLQSVPGVDCTTQPGELYLKVSAQGIDTGDAQANAKIHLHELCKSVKVAVRLYSAT